MATPSENQNEPDNKAALSETWSTMHMLALDSTKLSGQAQTASLPMGSGITKIYSTGDIVDNSYRLLSLLGTGGMGVVFHCQHLILGKEYALKLLAPDKLSAESWKRFQSEAKALARLHHPGVVGIHNMGVDAQECPYYVMDLLEGESLAQIVKDKQRLPVSRALPIFVQLAEALESAHQQGIIHRDIKPSNVMVLHANDKDTVKVVDFGIARLSNRGVGNTFNSQNKTAAGTVFGTPYYISPEQSLGQGVDHRADIYSLGCALFEALTGVPPFCGANAFETILMHQTRESPPLNGVYPEGKFSTSLETAVAKMLTKNAADRYQSMKLVALDLSRIQAGKTIGATIAPSKRAEIGASGDAIDDHVDHSLDHSLDHSAVSQSNKRMLIALAATATLVLFAGIAGIFTLGHSTNAKTTPKLVSPLNEDETESADILTRWRAIYKRQLDLTGFYHPKVNAKGEEIKQFTFPQENCHIGYLRWDDGPYKAAVGTIDVPAKAKTYLYLQCVCTPFPEMCDKLGRNTLTGLEIVTYKVPEVIQRLQNWTKLEHLSFFNSLEREKGFDCSLVLKEHISYIDTLSHLKFLGLCGQLRIGKPDKGEELTGPDICQLQLLSTLEGLALQEVRDVRPLLKKINLSPNIKTLKLINLDLNLDDINIISKNKNLESITIFNCPGMTAGAIPLFSQMPSLKHLVTNQDWRTDLKKPNQVKLPAYEYENYKEKRLY